MTERPRPSFDRGRLAALAAIAAGLGIALWVVTIGRAQAFGLGVDFHIFSEAAAALARGVNPYSAAAVPAGSAAGFPYPPALLLLLQPLTRLPFWTAYLIYTLIAGTTAAAAILRFAHRLGWTRGWPLTVGILTSWVGLSGLIWGQVDAILLVTLIGSILLAWQRRALAAGLVIGLVWIKPDILWPAVPFIGLALWPDRRAVLRYGAGVVLTSVLFFASGFEYLLPWVHSLLRFSGGVGTQPDLAGVSAWVDALPAGWHLGAGLSSPLVWSIVLGALATVAWLARQVVASQRWKRLRPDRRLLWAISLALGIWLLATPYAHPNDDLVLPPLLMLVLGRDAVRAARPETAVCLMLLATVPISWQLHVLPVALTPVAVAALLALGVAAFRHETQALIGPSPAIVPGTSTSWAPTIVRESTTPTV